MALPNLDITPDPIDLPAELEYLLGRALADDFNQEEPTPLRSSVAADRSNQETTVIAGFIAGAVDDDGADVRPDRWIPETEPDAEWCMGRLAEADAALEQLARQRDDYIERAQTAYWRQAAYWRRTATFFRAHLEQWGIRQRDAAENAAAAAGRSSFPKTFHLPSGQVPTRRAAEPVAAIASEADVIAWAERECREVLTTKLSVKVTDLREHVGIRPRPDSDDPDDLIVVRRFPDPDSGEMLLDGEPVPGAAVERPRTTATAKPDLTAWKD